MWRSNGLLFQLTRVSRRCCSGFSSSFQMNLYVKLLACSLLAIALWPATSSARHLALRPLTPLEVQQILRAAGREDAVPAGRSVASGLAALSGFTVGIVKGVGGSILYDVVTSNATMSYLTGLFSNSSSSTSDSTTQEICFVSRSVDGDVAQGRASRAVKDDDSEVGIYNDEDEPQMPFDPRQASSASSSTTPTGTSSTSVGTSPTASTSPISSSPTTTSGSSGDGSGVTCVVLNKGSSRHRRSATKRGERRQKRLRPLRLRH